MISCTKDNQKPTINLVGSNPYYLPLNSEYFDPGVEAIDPEDGNITSSVLTKTNLNVDSVGQYIIQYVVYDNSIGNSGSQGSDVATRTIVVFNEAEELQGDYSAINKCGIYGIEIDYIDQISLSNKDNRIVIFNNFANYTSSNIIGELNNQETKLVIPKQYITVSEEGNSFSTFLWGETIFFTTDSFEIIYKDSSNNITRNGRNIYKRKY
jgi:hypothetical protein